MGNVFFMILAIIGAQIGVAQDNALVNHILTNEDLCVQGYGEDRIYLNPERIMLTENGIFFEGRGMRAPITELYSDVSGCYIKPLTKFEILNRCKGCGSSYFIRCRTAGCPFNPDTPK